MGYSYTMRTWIVIVPVLAVGMLQISGCTSPPDEFPSPPPPGGIYRSESAGALFEQSVTLNNPEEAGPAHVAEFSFKGAHRPRFRPSTIYVAAGGHGYVVSIDDGKTWRNVKVPLASVLDIVALEENIVVVTGVDGTGQGYIVRSSNEGESWQTVLTVPVPTKKGGIQQFGIGNRADVATVIISIAPDPFDANRLYAGTSLGNVFVGEQFAKTWRKIHSLDTAAFSSNQQKFAIVDLVPSPHTAGEILVVTTGGRLYHVAAAAKQREIKVSVGQSTAVLSAAFVPHFPDALVVGINDGAAISRDRGATWQPLSLPVDTIQRFNTVVVRVSPTNPNRVLVAIHDVVYRSEDAGATWNTFSLSVASHVIIDLLINPENAANVVAVTTPRQG